MAKHGLQKLKEFVMTGMYSGIFRINSCSFLVLILVVFSSHVSVEACQNETGPTYSTKKSLLGLLIEPPVAAAEASESNEPVPFSISTMAGDHVPPFAAHPELVPVEAKSAEVNVSYEENMPTERNEVDSIDDCCRELSEMIAGNLGSDISLESKKRMIATALKMVARNVALKADARITQLKAEHALEMARMQSQMSSMRSTNSAAEQINRIAGPLSAMLQKNYQQAVAMNLGNQQLSQSLAQLGFQRLKDQADEVRATRDTIRLTSPESKQRESQWRIAQLTEQISRLQQQLRSQNMTPRSDERQRSNVRPAAYQQPLQPRRQPLEPLPMYQRPESSFENPYQRLPDPRYR